MAKTTIDPLMFATQYARLFVPVQPEPLTAVLSDCPLQLDWTCLLLWSEGYDAVWFTVDRFKLPVTNKVVLAQNVLYTNAPVELIMDVVYYLSNWLR
jgi:hypothetical protein